jgi:hypothetical protein
LEAFVLLKKGLHANPQRLGQKQNLLVTYAPKLRLNLGDDAFTNVPPDSAASRRQRNAGMIRQQFPCNDSHHLYEGSTAGQAKSVR